MLVFWVVVFDWFAVMVLVRWWVSVVLTTLCGCVLVCYSLLVLLLRCCLFLYYSCCSGFGVVLLWTLL